MDAPTGQRQIAEVWRLRGDVVRHPVRLVVMGPDDDPTLLEHAAFVRWASFHLAEGLGVPRARRHLDEVENELRVRGAGRDLARFLGATATDRATEQERSPRAALAATGVVPAARQLVDAVSWMAAQEDEAARLGAFGMGLPCCRAHQAPVLERLAWAIAADPGAGVEAAEAAVLVLGAQLVLLDSDLAAIRRRSMELHPTTGHRPRTALQPAG